MGTCVPSNGRRKVCRSVGLDGSHALAGANESGPTSAQWKNASPNTRAAHCEGNTNSETNSEFVQWTFAYAYMYINWLLKTGQSTIVYETGLLQLQLAP